MAFAETVPTPSASLEELLARLGVRMTYAKDEAFYVQGDDADFVYRLVSGAVRTTRLTMDGRRQIGEFYYPGELFGLEPGPDHRFSAEALGDCVVLTLKRSALRAEGGDGALQRAITEAALVELDRAQTHLLLLGRKTARERVASFLVDLSRRQPGKLVELAMSRQDMADYLGLTIETVSRMLTQLQGDRLVCFAGCRQFRVSNSAALERLAE